MCWHGPRKKRIGRIHCLKKCYSFLRSWMDNGLGTNEICDTLKHLRELGKRDCQNLGRKALESLAPAAMSDSICA